MPPGSRFCLVHCPARNFGQHGVEHFIQQRLAPNVLHYDVARHATSAKTRVGDVRSYFLVAKIEIRSDVLIFHLNVQHSLKVNNFPLSYSHESLLKSIYGTNMIIARTLCARKQTNMSLIRGLFLSYIDVDMRNAVVYDARNELAAYFDLNSGQLKLWATEQI